MKKQLKVIAVVLLAAVLCKGSLFPAAPAGETGRKHGLAPVNPDFSIYIKNIEKGIEPSFSTNGYKQGYIPPPVDMSHVKGVIDERANQSYPSYYNLRDLGRVTRVKDQGSYPACWIFAAYASLESCLLPEEVDFSEWHLANNHGFDYGIQDAGNSWMTTAYLIRWSGPVEEWLVPYPSIAAPLFDLNRIFSTYPVSKHVQQVIFLPERENPLDNNTIKYFLTEYGPVDFAMNWVFNNFDSNHNSQYTPNNRNQNHRLAIVGWDDDYPASNFRYRPPGSGAFIARNSWGVNWAEGGYCYISYYDLSLQEFTCFNNAEHVTNYESIYQYDPLGRTSSWGDRDSWGANVFTAFDNRALDAVGFYTNDSNVQYNIYIYKSLNETDIANNPRNGSPAAEKTGNFTYPGFYTVRLDDPVPLETGERFSVVIRFVNSINPYSVPLEIPILRHSSAAWANPGESYVSRDGMEWEDLTELVPDSNVCIKAYTEFPGARITLQAERVTLRAWIIRRDYGEISFTIENLDEVPVSTIVLLRRSMGGEFEELVHISPDELSNGRYSYSDRYLERTGRYTYQVVAYNSGGLVTGRSNAETI